MEQQNYGGGVGGGSWKMIQTNSTVPHSNQDQSYSQQQSLPPFQTLYNQHPPQQQRLAPQQQHHQSLASHFNLLPMVQNLADAIDNGTRDPHFDSLVSDLTTQYDQCQQLLNSISASISSKSMTAEGQKQKREEAQQLLNQRRELIAKSRTSVEQLLKSEL